MPQREDRGPEENRAANRPEASKIELCRKTQNRFADFWSDGR